MQTKVSCRASYDYRFRSSCKQQEFICGVRSILWIGNLCVLFATAFEFEPITGDYKVYYYDATLEDDPGRDSDDMEYSVCVGKFRLLRCTDEGELL